MFDKSVLQQIDNLTLEQLERLYHSLSEYDEEPVGIQEFLESPDYLGGYFQNSLYPYWKEVLKEIYPSPYFSPYWCISLRGAIGQGKSTVACAGIAYDLYLLLCMSRPQKHAGLIEQTKIVFAIFNVTLSLATDVIWDTLSQMFISSPYFSRFVDPMGMGHKKKKRRDETLFPKRIDFFMGSRIGHTLGKAVYTAILSEANFEVMEGQVYKNFNSLLRRMGSRFMKKGGGTIGKIWVDSSESDKFSTVNKIIDQYKTDPGVLVVQNSLWNVAAHRYNKERFWVYAGSDTRPPEVMTPDSDLLIVDPDNCIQVPEEHRRDFVADIHSALRDLAGRSTGSSYRLFRLKDKLLKAFRVTPLFPDEIRVDFDDDTDQVINYALAPNYFKNVPYKNSPRYIHIDIGISQDRLGIAASYIRGMIERKIRDPHTFEEITQVVPDVVTEWAFGVVPTPGKQIPLWKIRGFVQWLTKQGYIIGGITCDGYQSTDMLQQFTHMGYQNIEVLSVDKTSAPYFQFRSATYEGRLSLPVNELLKKECENLEVSPDGKKVDHPKQNLDNTPGSKDVADAACGSYNFALANKDKFNIMSVLDDKSQEVSQVASMFWGDRFGSDDHDDGDFG